MPTAAEVNAALERQKARQARTGQGPTAAEVNAALARQQARQVNPPAQEDSSIGPFTAGIAGPITKAGIGIRELVVPYLPEFMQESEQAYTDKLRRSQQQFEQEATGIPGTTGELISNIGLYGGGAAAGGRTAARMFPRAMAKRPGTTVAGGEIVGAGTTGALITPGTAEDRARAAALEAALTGGGQLTGALLARGLRGIRKTPEAEQLVAQGVPLTPGQAASGAPWAAAERFLGRTPGMVKSVGNLQENATKEWNRQLLQSTLPRIPGVDTPVVQEAGEKGFAQVQDYIGKIYDDLAERTAMALGRPGIKDLRDDVLADVIPELNATLDDTAAERITKYLTSQFNKVVRSSDKTMPAAFQNFQRRLRDYAKAARNKGEVVEEEIIERAINRMNSTIGAADPTIGKILTDTNRGYQALKVLERAGSYVKSTRQGYFTPDNLSSAVKAEGTPRTVAAGRAALSEESKIGQEAIGDMLPGMTGGSFRGGGLWPTAAVTAGAVLAPLATASSLLGGRALTSEPVRRALMGATPQRAAELSAALRAALGRTGAGLGGM